MERCGSQPCVPESLACCINTLLVDRPQLVQLLQNDAIIAAVKTVATLAVRGCAFGAESAGSTAQNTSSC